MVVDGATARSDPFKFSGLIGYGGDASTGPKAYLNILVFDKNDQLLTSAYTPVTGAAEEDGTDVLHEYLKINPITIQKTGYVYIYLSNETGSRVEVFFDDFKVTHTNSDIVQKDDYYPFGGSFNSYQSPSGVSQKYKYNGKELQEETDWYDYGARMYDAWLGRWNHVDPLAEIQSSLTPYRFGFNNPIRFNDPTGLYEGGSGTWNQDDPNFSNVLAYFGIVGDGDGDNKDSEDCPNGDCDDDKKVENKGKDPIKGGNEEKPYKNLPRVEIDLKLWAGLRTEFDIGAIGGKADIVSTNLLYGKIVLYLKNGKLVWKFENKSPILGLMLPNDISFEINSGVRLDLAEYGRYRFGGSFDVDINRDEVNGKVINLLLQNPQVKAGIGYMFVEGAGNLNFQKEKGSLRAKLGQDLGVGQYLGVTGSAWLVIPLIED